MVEDEHGHGHHLCTTQGVARPQGLPHQREMLDPSRLAELSQDLRKLEDAIGPLPAVAISISISTKIKLSDGDGAVQSVGYGQAHCGNVELWGRRQ